MAKSKIDQVPIVKECVDVCPKELLGLPPAREVEFGIELVLGIAPILIAPYKMYPTELKELKLQLQEFINREFIRPSVSTWGAPVLFVKKKDGSTTPSGCTNVQSVNTAIIYRNMRVGEYSKDRTQWRLGLGQF
ncbi:Transposon Ty3-G Gag-Pol polyprotein [Gossypium australe]|uniref:Transposon Ty3-G Gag-Pol polyprotein n=1 Tax=Gossypium australe TaxID=47621 RepID=A0A5B6WSL6_9ROSI|nr:Transposon Ty3-G Gag-Pol polyprotein [Gossypium australe]